MISLQELIDRAKAFGFVFGGGQEANRIRYWSTIGLIPHAIRKGGQTLYPKYTVDLLIKIQDLQNAGKGIAEIKEFVNREELKFRANEILNEESRGEVLKQGGESSVGEIKSIIPEKDRKKFPVKELAGAIAVLLLLLLALTSLAFWKSADREYLIKESGEVLAGFDAKKILLFNSLVKFGGTDDGFSIYGGDQISRRLTVKGSDVGLDQSLTATDSPKFASMNLTGGANQLVLGNNGTITWSPTGSRVGTIPDATGTFLFDSAGQTISNKTISGSNNTFSNIPVSALASSAVTINTSGTLSGGGSVTLGGSISLSGSGGVTSTASAGYLPLQTAGGNLGNSVLTQNGTTLQVSGTDAVTVSSASCVVAANGIVTGSGACPGGASKWQLNAGVVSPNDVTQSLAIGGSATSSAKFLVYGVSVLNPVASVSASSSQAAFVIDNTVGDLFTASSSGLGRFSIAQNGNVAIGTTAPQQKLVIDADQAASSQSGYLTAGNMLLGQNQGGAYFGRVGIKEQQLGLTGYGENWKQTASIPDLNSVDVSSDGRFQTAVTYGRGGSSIFVSTDFGYSWVDKSVYVDWDDVAMSADGKVQVAVGASASPKIYVSTDYGNSWSPFGPSVSLSGVAVSSDGKIMTAVGSGGGQIYISWDFGKTWTTIDNAAYWTDVAMSSDGKLQTAVIGTGQIYVSNDYGKTWSAKSSSNSRYAVAMSADGKYQIAGGEAGPIYLSTDYGNTWNTKGNTATWYGMDMSADGKVQMAVAEGGQVNVSIDYGNTWSVKGPSDTWREIAMTTDGKLAVGVTNSGKVYRSFADSFLADGGMAIGTTSGLLATFDVRGSLGTLGVASISGATSKASLTVDNSVGDLFTASSSGLSRFVIKQNGNVGIGTGQPSNLFHIQTGGGTQGFSLSNGSSAIELFPFVSGYQNNLVRGTGGSSLDFLDATNGLYTFKDPGGLGGTLDIQNTSSGTGIRLSGGGNSYFNAGNVGIGSTASSFKLQVQDAQSATASAMVLNTSTGVDADGLIVKLGFTGTGATTNSFITFLDGEGRINGQIRSNGANGVAYQTTGIADFAEYMKFQGQRPEDGLVVCQKDLGVTPCDSSEGIIGVTSAHPNFVGGEETVDSVAVGFVGQVQVRVSPESAKIVPGDILTPDPRFPGYVKKVSFSGNAVGKALGNWNGGTKMVLAYLNVGYAKVKSGDTENAGAELPELPKLVDMTRIDNLDISSVSGELKVYGKTNLSETSIGGKLNVGLLVFDDVRGDIKSLSEKLSIQEGAVIIDKNGDLTTFGNIEAKSIKVEKISVREEPESTQSGLIKASIGTIYLDKGESDKVVQTSSLTEFSKIFVSPVEEPVAVSAEKTEQDRFEIRLKEPAQKRISVNWWIIN